MNNAIQLTEEGLSELIAELENLKSKRGEIAERIATAREFGDLRENAEYSAAREEQGVVETRIAELEEIISNAEVVGENDSDRISIGSVVKVKRLSDKKQFEYKIVGSVEADPMSDKISDQSPMGVALLGQEPGQKIIVDAPSGKIEYQIISFE